MSGEDWNDGRNTEDVYHLGVQHGRAEAEAEIARLRTEGTPGVMHAVDRAFYDLTVMQRDAAWREIEQLRALMRDVDDREADSAG